MASYDKYFSGDLFNYDYPEEKIAKSLANCRRSELKPTEEHPVFPSRSGLSASRKTRSIAINNQKLKKHNHFRQGKATQQAAP